MPGKRPKVLFSLSYAHGVVPGVIVAVRGQNVPFTFAVASVNNGLVAEIVLLCSLAGTGIAFQQLAGGAEFQHRPPGAIRAGHAAYFFRGAENQVPNGVVRRVAVLVKNRHPGRNWPQKGFCHDLCGGNLPPVPFQIREVHKAFCAVPL